MTTTSPTPLNRWTEQDLRRRRFQRRFAGSIEGLFGVGGVVYAIQAYTRYGEFRLLDVAVGALGFLEMTLGVAFALGKRWPRVLLWPLSAIHLLIFPVGTLLAGYVLWVLYDTRHESAPRRAA